MEQLYEYLIGGKKIGKKSIIKKFAELKKGDTIYKYVKMGNDRGYINKYIIEYAVAKDTITKGGYKQFCYLIQFDEGLVVIQYGDAVEKSFYKGTNTQKIKEYYATTLDEILDNIENKNIKIEV